MLRSWGERLRLASPKLKQAIVDACAHTVLLDNKVTLSETDLLRAIAMTLDCHIPQFTNPQRNVLSSTLSIFQQRARIRYNPYGM